jgi:co-chaperonin GroES (HSP10)
MLKSQNRGIVVMAGSQCTWLKKDDYVVFYRAAGTDLTEDKIDYVLVHEDHCLTTIEKK